MNKQICLDMLQGQKEKEPETDLMARATVQHSLSFQQ